jgi:hypothetical protein
MLDLLYIVGDSVVREWRLTDGVADGPGDEVHGDGEGLFGLAGDVSGGGFSEVL